MNRWYLIFMVMLCIVYSCGESDSGPFNPIPEPDDLTQIPYTPEEYVLDIPDHFPRMEVPDDNPLTKAGVELGRHLFYDPILSLDSSMSCSSCHLPAGNFTDNESNSTGVTQMQTRRSSMTLLNVGFVTNGLFWDGRSPTLEDQALLPIEDPIELHEDWPNVERKLQAHAEYPRMFREAFGITSYEEITRNLSAMAMAQFQRTLISSGNSKYDRVIAGEVVFTDQELTGHDIFFDINDDVNRHAECGHCHNAPLFTTNEFFNNGVQTPDANNSFKDNGHGEVTNLSFDNGMFRTPTLRNIFLSAPYMHDGRFETIDDVIDHYITGGHPAPNLSPILHPLEMRADDRAALIAFIKTLEDPDFVNNPEFQNPFIR